VLSPFAALAANRLSELRDRVRWLPLRLFHSFPLRIFTHCNAVASFSPISET